MRFSLIIVCGTAVAACSPPHRFEIQSDKPIQNVEVDLVNGHRSEVNTISPRHAVAEVRSGDNSGEIRVKLASNETAVCQIGYITNGEREPHHLEIRNGGCRVRL